MSDIDPRLEKFLPIRIIIRKEPNGRYSGMVEHSFSLDWDLHRVNIFWSGKAYSQFGTIHKLDAVETAEYNNEHMKGEIFDPLSPECPIAVDFTSWLEALATKPRNKFDCRNAFFEQR